MGKQQDNQWSRRELLSMMGAALLAQGCGLSREPDEVDVQTGYLVAAPPDLTLESPRFVMGVASGDVTETTAVLWTQHDTARELELVVYLMQGSEYLEEVVATLVQVDAGGFVHVRVNGLSAGARYRYAFFELEGAQRKARSQIGRFRAALAADATEIVTFGACACTNNGRSMDVLSQAGARTDLDCFLLLGDTTYNDSATTLAQYRSKWRQNFSTAGYRSLRGSTSLIATWDDHEVTNDWNPETLSQSRVAIATQTFFEHLPLARSENAPNQIWRKLRWGKTVEFFVLDCRGERKPSTRSAANAQYISRAQMDWLKTGLETSPARFKVIMNSVPISDFPGLFDLLKRDRWEGYPAQRDEILRHVEQRNIRGVLWVAGDFHLASVGRASASGVGSNALEVLAGPGAQSANPLLGSVRGSQFDWASGTNNYASFELDPATLRARIRHHGARGEILSDRTYPL